jgi:putative addiction module component (TIGR02574 family)
VFIFLMATDLINSKSIFTTEVFDMTARAEQVLTEALSLPPSERAQLAERLFSSLDISQEELDRLWAQEADSRIDAYDRGDIKAISASDVFKNLSD